MSFIEFESVYKTYKMGEVTYLSWQDMYKDIGGLEATANITLDDAYKIALENVVDALITNFHLPESTLMMLVSALYSKEEIFKAYETAVSEKYRFFSFGDAMYIE